MSRRWAWVVVTVAGCASGRPLEQGDAATVDAPGVDSPSQTADAPGDGVRPDAPMIDAMIDAQVGPEACVPTANEKLVNPVFDSLPMGTGWTETRSAPNFAIVTDEAIEHSVPYAAFLGGIAGENLDPPRSAYTDVLVQQFSFPADTTTVVLTGQYHVYTEETVSGVYDRASVSLLDAATDALIETAFAVDDNQGTTGYTSFQHTFATNLAGRTVKIRLTSSHDATDLTAFLFDTLSLKATHCP